MNSNMISKVLIIYIQGVRLLFIVETEIPQKIKQFLGI